MTRTKKRRSGVKRTADRKKSAAGRRGRGPSSSKASTEGKPSESTAVQQHKTGATSAEPGKPAPRKRSARSRRVTEVRNMVGPVKNEGRLNKKPSGKSRDEDQKVPFFKKKTSAKQAPIFKTKEGIKKVSSYKGKESGKRSLANQNIEVTGKKPFFKTKTTARTSPPAKNKAGNEKPSYTTFKSKKTSSTQDD